MQNLDFIIVGQGLAGTALAWQLRWLGQRGLIIDRGDAITASKIAAGLITPITGKRLALDGRFDEYLAAAHEFYRRVEAETGEMIFHHPGSVRILRDDNERRRFERKRDDELRNHIASVKLDESQFYAPHGSFSVPAASRLDVVAYLNASRRVFESDGSFRIASFDEVDVATKCVIFCTGITAYREKQLPSEWFQPAKGEILTLRIPGLAEDRIINRGAWLMRIGGELYRAGATYTWDDLDDQPTVMGKAELVRRVAEFLKVPFEVLAHNAATRPITVDRQPVIHEVSPSVWVFNGLGSKGALLAPSYSRQLANMILTNGGCQRPDSATKENRGTDTPRSPRKLTEQVHNRLRTVLKPCDIAIDATAGNGHDTLFLANAVGPSGHVFAFDIQAAAIEATTRRLVEVGRSNVTLFQCDHADMASRIPIEHHGCVMAVTFNLGYLPGGDKRIVTSATPTAVAIQAALLLLAPGGILTVMTYIAHPGGLQEDECVRQTLKGSSYETITGDSETSPRLYVVTKPLSSSLGG